MTSHCDRSPPPPLYKKNKKKKFSVGYLKKQKWDVTNYHIDLIFMMTSQCYRIGMPRKSLWRHKWLPHPPPPPKRKKSTHTQTKLFAVIVKFVQVGGRKPSKKKGENKAIMMHGKSPQSDVECTTWQTGSCKLFHYFSINLDEIWYTHVKFSSEQFLFFVYYSKVYIFWSYSRKIYFWPFI